MYDVLIIGAGTAGIAAAKQLEKLDARYLLIEAGDGGTTCAKTGCMPSKGLIEIAKKVNNVQSLTKDNLVLQDQFEVDTGSVLTKVRALRDHFVDRAIQGSEKFLRIKGHATFIDANTVEVNGEKISANNIIIANGSRPRIPDAFEEVKS
ncbi:MAG: FAD-dependent oxidoreductase, partial [Gammaproteobacteria bacterium]|nr:FAD-dependent oxidoreductase [Gammaproteobacteria bacterium]